MRYRNWVIAVLFFTIGMSAFGAGLQYEKRSRQHKEVDGGCAYYDMETGEFMWGPKPVVLGILPPNLPPALQDAAHQLQEGLAKAFKGKGN